MAKSKTKIESQVMELSTVAFEAFCADVSVMFGLEARCKQQKVSDKSLKDLNKYFKKLAAVVSVEAKGALDGTFRLFLDRAGLFTLAGITFPLTEEQILKKTEEGLTKDARALSNALADAAKIIIEAWDKPFREKLPNHDGFAQTDIFIGDPWKKPQEKVGLAADEKCLSVICEMTVGPYPAFNCAAVFPKTIFAGSSQQQTEPEQETDSEPEDKTEQPTKAESEDKTQDRAEPALEQTAEAQAEQEPALAAEEKTEPQAQEEPAPAPQENAGVTAEDQPPSEPEEKVAEPNEQAPAGDSEPPAATDADKETGDETQNAESVQTEPVAEAQTDDTGTDAPPEVAEENTPPDETSRRPVSDAIRSMTAPSAESLSEREESLPQTHGPGLKIPAKDIMQKDISWAGPEHSVQEALAMLQQSDAGYILVGTDGKLEGLVSRSDVNGALSPYLQPMFAKWRRPLDDATLQIKIRWIMTRTIRTVSPDTPLAAIMETMCQFGWRALPVIDQQGAVQGLVTVFDVFRALLKADSNTSTVGGTLQAPLLA
ncbi:MAG: CBS domain-containing protein [Planctomycetota bacterium]|nr:MAG: CBS domain-containing protein [Planctomycetota bacterium]